jgi:dienelactone hydrolase
MNHAPLRLALAVALLAFSGAALAQRIATNAHQPVLAGDAIDLSLLDLKPGQTVSLSATRVVRMFTGQVSLFAAEAKFTADAMGRVDLATQAPLPNSSYEGADVRGLLWSMKPVAGETQGKTFNEIAFTLRGDDGKALAEAKLQLRMALPEVVTRKVDAFPGAVFASLPGSAKRPTLILLGGSEGGSMIARDAAPWASRGYAVLALPYYSPPQWGPTGPMPAELPSLPAEFIQIPVERLEQARDWLAQQPEADASRIGVMGTSKGAEFVLLAGVKMPWIRAVAAIVPTDVVWEGWGQAPRPEGPTASFAWKGEPYAFVPYKDFAQEFAGMGTGQPVKIRRPHDKGRAAASPEVIAAARIPVERIKAPVLVAGGSDDQLWDSGGMAANIAAAREKAGLPTVALVFPDAGHFLGGTGTGPTTHYNDGPMKNGGTPAATARAQASTYAALLKFFADHLK